MLDIETTTISTERYEELLAAEAELNALYGAGVDNWEGFDEALDYLRETR